MEAKDVLKLDLLTFEILKDVLVNVCNRMDSVLSRSALSPPLTEGRDIGSAILDTKGRLAFISDYNSEAIMGTVQATVESAIQNIDEFYPEDVIMCNDPWAGTHCNDIRFVEPVFYKDELQAFVVTAGHHVDVGGNTPGGYYPQATENFQEGLLIPPMKIVEKGKINRQLLNLFRRNVRVGEQQLGDIHGEITTVHTGRRLLQEVFDRYGLDTILTEFEDVMNYSEALLREEISKSPEGAYGWQDALDYDPGLYAITGEKKRLWVRLKMQVKGDRVTYDYTGSDPQPLGASGCTRSHLECAVNTGTACIFNGVPFNYGFTRAIEVKSKPRTMVDVQPPAAINGMTTGGFELAQSCLWHAWLDCRPEKSITCPANVTVMTIGGYDTRYDRPYVEYLWTEMGGGARHEKDGLNGTVGLYVSGLTNFPIEYYEHWYPVLNYEYSFSRKSAGAGKWRGGFGVQRRWRVTHGNQANTISIMGNRGELETVPWGYGGGRKPKETQGLVRNPGTPSEKWIGVLWGGEKFQVGETFKCWTTGGGGRGDPLDRDPNLVLEDVIDEFITVEEAEEDYGVVVRVIDRRKALYEIDPEATEELRKSRKEGRK